jgi:hypothetical protein
VDSRGRPVYAPEGHRLLRYPPGTPRPAVGDEQIEEAGRRVGPPSDRKERLAMGGIIGMLIVSVAGAAVLVVARLFN